MRRRGWGRWHDPWRYSVVTTSATASKTSSFRQLARQLSLSRLSEGGPAHGAAIRYCRHLEWEILLSALVILLQWIDNLFGAPARFFADESIFMPPVRSFEESTARIVEQALLASSSDKIFVAHNGCGNNYNH